MIFIIVEWLRGYLMPYPFWIKDLGARGEYLGRRYWHRRGFHLVERNWRCGHGEIDAVMANYRELVFLEMKTRTLKKGSDLRIGDTLSHSQEKRLLRLAQQFLAQWEEPIPWKYYLVFVSVEGRRHQIQLATL